MNIKFESSNILLSRIKSSIGSTGQWDVSFPVRSFRSAPFPVRVSSTELYSLLLPVPSTPEHSTPTQTLAAALSSPGDLREAGFGPSRRSNSDPSGGGLGPPAQQVCGAGFGIGAMSWAGPDEILLSTSLAGFLDSELLRSSACDVPELAWLLILALVSCD